MGMIMKTPPPDPYPLTPLIYAPLLLKLHWLDREQVIGAENFRV
jgi:hypothetical protein